MASSHPHISEGMALVEELLAKTYTDHQLETNVNAMCMHVVSAGGKRMRPRLVLLSAHALPDFNREESLEDVCHIAAAIELLHTATLVHDDVIDKAVTRRGVTTLNDTSGNHAAILAGDYLFTRCFDMIQRPRNFDIIVAINATLSQLVVGELYQLEHEGDINLSIDTYYKTIYAKTGVLFELSSSCPAILNPKYKHLVEPMKTFGRLLGIAFQIKDDMLDYTADSKDLGKDPGVDLNDQRITLPVLIALQATKDEAERNKLLDYIKQADFEGVMSFIKKTDALQKCEDEAIRTINEAIAILDLLPPSQYKDEMIALSHKVIERNA